MRAEEFFFFFFYSGETRKPVSPQRLTHMLLLLLLWFQVANYREIRTSSQRKKRFYFLLCVCMSNVCLFSTHKAFCSVVHDAQLETLLVLEGLCQSAAEGVWRQHSLTAELELGEDALHKDKNTQTKDFAEPKTLCIMFAYHWQCVFVRTALRLQSTNS